MGECDLHKAAEEGDLETVKALIAEGRNVNKKLYLHEAYWGHPPLFFAKGGSVPQQVEIGKLLINAGADIHWRDDSGLTYLHNDLLLYSEGDFHLEFIKMLITAGADIEAIDSKGDRPIFGATRISGKWQLESLCLEDSVKALKILVDGGADVNVTDSRGDTPLHSIFGRYAAFDNECGCDCEVAKSKIKILLDAGAKVNARDKQGNTPLHLMVETVFMNRFALRGELTNNLEVLAIVIAAGGDAWIKNQANQTPLEYGLRYFEPPYRGEVVEKVKQYLGL